VIGTTHDSPRFAVDNLARWWVYDGHRRYPGATELLVLADAAEATGLATAPGNTPCNSGCATATASP